MSCGEFSGETFPLVTAAVQSAKRDGHKIGDALEMTGRRLGLTKRFVQAVYYSEPVRITRDRYHAILAAWWRDMDRQADDLRARAAEMERQSERAQLAGRQLELDLSCGQPQQRRSASGYRALPMRSAGCGSGTV